MTLPEAKELGALALFDETYGEKVRVVEIGGVWSRELCGGTRVEHAAQIGVALASESSVGAGMRRLEAAVGIEGFAYLARERYLVNRVAEQLQAPRGELPDRVAAALPDRLKTTDRENQRLRRQAHQARAADLAAQAADVRGTLVVTTTTQDDARALAVAVRDALLAGRPGVVVIGRDSGGPVVAAVNAAARAAGQDAAAQVQRLLGGRGGGTPDLAQGGGLPADRLARALESVLGIVARA